MTIDNLSSDLDKIRMEDVIFEMFRSKFGLKIKKAGFNSWLGFGYHPKDTYMCLPAIVRFNTDCFYIICQDDCSLEDGDCEHFVKVSYAASLRKYSRLIKSRIDEWDKRFAT